jgi:hypothetical protein
VVSYCGFLFHLAHKICFCFYVCTVCLLAVYHLALKSINPKVAADIQSYFYFNVYACMYVGQLFPFVCEELHSVGHEWTVWLLQVNTQVICELEEGRVKSWR